MRKRVFNAVMWSLVKLKICDKIVITTFATKSFDAYVEKGNYL